MVRDGVEIVSREDRIRLISLSEMHGEVDCSNQELVFANMALKEGRASPSLICLRRRP